MRARVVLLLTILGLVMAVTASPVSAGGATGNIMLGMGDSPDPVVGGSNLTYDFGVFSECGNPASNVIVSDTLPPGTTFVSLSVLEPGWNLTTPPVGSSGTVLATHPSLPSCMGQHFFLVVHVSPTLPNGTVLTNLLTATNTTNEFVGTISETTTVTSPAQLSKVDSVDPVLPGGSLTYTVTVENVGQADLTSVSVTDTFPSGLTFVDATVSQGSGTVGTPANDLDWLVGTLAPAAQAILTITFTVDAGLAPGTVLTNTANGTSDQTAAFLDVETTTVGALSADLRVTNTDSPDPVAAGAHVVYQLGLGNFGPDTASDVQVVFTVPAGTTVFSTAGAGVTTVVTPTTVTFTRNNPMGPLTGQPLFVELLVDPGVATGTILTSTASVTSSTDDPDLSNNTATQQTTVNPGATPPTPVASNLPDAALLESGPTSGLAPLAFAALLIGTLGVLVVANARAAARRR